MDCELYVITDSAAGRGRSHEDMARLALEGGADIIQLRDKSLGTGGLIAIGRRIAGIARESGALFIVNDRPDIAIACGASGVHLGQDDMPPAHARKVAPAGFVIGVSVGTAGEAKAAEAAGADYLAASPVFPTPSKTDTPAYCGLDGIRRIRAASPLPLVAIGGIGRANAREVIMAGADGVAVISAVVGEPDITAAARELKEIVRQARAERSMRSGHERQEGDGGHL